MLIYDDQGTMHHEQAAEFSKNLGELVAVLLRDLFAQGMTVLECRALLGHLGCEIDYVAALEMLYAQSDKKESEKDDCSGTDNGASTARDE